MPPDSPSLLHLLLTRLERISTDSPWAQRASGLRAALACFAFELRDLVRTCNFKSKGHMHADLFGSIDARLPPPVVVMSPLSRHK